MRDVTTHSEYLWGDNSGGVVLHQLEHAPLDTSALNAHVNTDNPFVGTLEAVRHGGYVSGYVYAADGTACAPADHDVKFLPWLTPRELRAYLPPRQSPAAAQVDADISMADDDDINMADDDSARRRTDGEEEEQQQQHQQPPSLRSPFRLVASPVREPHTPTPLPRVAQLHKADNEGLAKEQVDTRQDEMEVDRDGHDSDDSYGYDFPPSYSSDEEEEEEEQPTYAPAARKWPQSPRTPDQPIRYALWSE